MVERAIYRLCRAVLRRVSAGVVVSVRVGRCVVVCADGDIFLSVTSAYLYSYLSYYLYLYLLSGLTLFSYR